MEPLQFDFTFDIITLIIFYFSVFSAKIASKLTLTYLVGLLFTILLNFGDGSHKEIYSTSWEEAYIHLGQNRSKEWEHNYKPN